MLDRHYKQLWETRFLKILESEKEAFLFYKYLIETNKNLLERTKAKPVLEQIMRDEASHARVACKLIRLVRRKKISEREGGNG
ncbi:MAG: hypothetical protein A3C35_05405 [Omnitrophica bacterium RIFCSPHIGHO2_02_FULL_46_11]|nr:MAG: hypothetical protein A3A81_02795 [Omnitrophica bacterium RIFCSPLOWO2_01_FULL_45_10b]OGW86830.1 MAG: hypothetical protein A3C35_05405 [Omnitrophica bacterium RIFCSPHIGHO2_02_FULL_46_11]